MARYIDADKLIAHLKDEIKGCEPPFGSRANGKSIAYGTKLGLKSAISFAETLSTADVISKEFLTRKEDEAYERGYAEAKADVAREIFEEIEKVIGEKYNRYVFGNNELDSIEQDAIINFSDSLSDCFAELKKKYTEEQK